MNVSLPPALTAAIEQRLEGVSRKDLAARADAFSKAYRSGGTSQGIAEEADVLAYLVARLPATYAAVTAAFHATIEVYPEFAPATLLDIGAGPGAASWAAVELWRSLSTVTLIDHNPRFLGTARELAAKAGHDALRNAHIVAGDLGAAAQQPKSDLVVASYVLAELPEDRAAQVARDLWQSSAAMLVLVEPGTPAGFARIRAVREALIAEGAHAVAPCTHDRPCPMQAPDWCHFSQRLSRSRDHMRTKDAHVPFEDERYSYFAAARVPPPKVNRARIIAPPEETKAAIALPLCDERGLHRGVINRRDRAAYNLLRKARWGDTIVSED
ncbi:MAG TPA: small ribosomal subunit Rsm22 family protein [Rhizomicrobium sp.]|jgi:ribosomal protein RSM22 (predicted rRNA methylase)